MERFWSKVDKSSDCWIWQAGTNSTGYGYFSVGGSSGYMARAHRVAWELINGPIPEGLLVLHKCDIKLCVRPEHLFLGSQQDNINDMIRKGRDGNRKGSTHGMAKLSFEKVKEIRERYLSGGCTQMQLALEYGISLGHMSLVVNNKIW